MSEAAEAAEAAERLGEGTAGVREGVRDESEALVVSSEGFTS